MNPLERKRLMAEVDSRAIAFLRGLNDLARKDPESRLLWEQAHQMAGRARGALVVELVKEKRA